MKNSTLLNPTSLGKILTSLIFLALSYSALADKLDFGPSNEAEFLRVEQAYQVLVEYKAGEVKTSWIIAPGYYLYQHKFKIEASNGAKTEPLELSFEPGKKKFDEYYNKALEVYYLSAFVNGRIANIAPPLELKVTSQGCADKGLCYPPRHQYFQVNTDGSVTELAKSQLSQPKGTAVTAANLTTTPTSSATAQTPPPSTENPFLPLVILGAFVGGLILNLMPCVFPVLSLKALSFASSGDKSQQEHHRHGWAYTAGVIISFLTAGAILVGARQAGEMLGWGFQLQQPLFVAALAYLFLVMGLSLFGIFHIGAQFMGAGQNLTSGAGLRASFFTGVLAALVASPCTAPLMAPALGVALTQPAIIALTIFFVLGFGMAAPFLALSYSPKLASYLPKPGLWMETLKQVLAFPLLATCIWLLWVLGNQTGSTGIAIALTGALLISFAIWLTRFISETKHNWPLRGLIIISLLAAAYLTWGLQSQTASSSSYATEKWETFTIERLDELTSAGTPVFVDLTADWCITCKVNERVAFSSEAFFSHAHELGVTLLVGDWTNPNDQIAALLKRYNRSGIPLYLVYPNTPNAEPEILPQLLTPDAIIDALDRAVTN